MPSRVSTMRTGVTGWKPTDEPDGVAPGVDGAGGLAAVGSTVKDQLTVRAAVVIDTS
jgi:hypothetical protein